MRCHKKKGSRRHMRGGVAPIAYSLAGDWSSKMSLGQGSDYQSYHVGQHGGSAPFPAAVIGTPLIPTNMNGPAMTDGTLNAYKDIAGLRDPPFDTAPPNANQSGAGRRRRRTHKKSKKSRKSSRKARRHRMRGGTHLGYASVNTPGMLLSSAGAYSQAGLNPGYITGGLEAQMAAERGDKN